MSGGTIALLIIIGFVLLIFSLLSFKLKICFIYKDKKADFFIKYLFIKLPISLEKKKNKKKEKKEEPGAEAAEKSEGKKAKELFFEQVSKLLSLLTSAGRILKTALSMHSAEIILNAKICGEDAAKTAIEVGKNSAYIHSALGVLANFVEIKKREISVLPDYEGGESEYTLRAVLYSRPVKLIFNIHKFLGELLKMADALPNKKIK